MPGANESNLSSDLVEDEVSEYSAGLYSRYSAVARAIADYSRRSVCLRQIEARYVDIYIASASPLPNSTSHFPAMFPAVHPRGSSEAV